MTPATNHEFCDECGISSFHHGVPCDPKRKAAYQKRITPRKRKAKVEHVKLEKTIDPLVTGAPSVRTAEPGCV